MRWTEQEARMICGTELEVVEPDLRSRQGWGLTRGLKATREADETNFRALILPRGDSVPPINIQLRALRPFSKRLPFSCLPSFHLSQDGRRDTVSLWGPYGISYGALRLSRGYGVHQSSGLSILGASIPREITKSSSSISGNRALTSARAEISGLFSRVSKVYD